MKRIVSAGLLASLLVAGCTREQVTPAPAATPPAAAAQSPPPAATPPVPTRPSLRVGTLDGGTFDLAAQRGKWVVVNFWATWCGPCLKEMPELSALDALREHIVVIGLAYEDATPDAMRAFLQQRPVVYPIAMVDVYAPPPPGFDTPRGLPLTYLVAPDGRIAKKYTGPVSARMLEDDIAAAGGPAVQAGA